MERKFDPKKLERLNNPDRIKDLPPEFIVSKLKISDPKLIIDIGAGTGFYSIQMSKQFPEAKIIACDISDTMLDWINANVIPNYKNIITHKMDESFTGLESDTADIILMINLHHELENRDKMMLECLRLLRSNSKIAISDWRKEEMPHGPPFQIRLNTSEVKNDLEKAGFKNIEIFDELKNNYLVVGEK